MRNCVTMLLAGAALAAIGTSPAAGQDPQSLAAKFGALESVAQMSLSPDGARIAYISPLANSGSALNIITIKDGTPRPILAAGKDQKLRYCQWVSNERLACWLRQTMEDSGQILGFSRVLAVNADGSKIEQLSARTRESSRGLMQFGGDIISYDLPGKPNSVLMEREFLPDRSTGRIVQRKAEGMGVEEVDTVSLRRRVVEAPRGSANTYIADSTGAVRIVGMMASNDETGYLKNKQTYLYRQPGSSDWKPLSSVTDDASGASHGFTPLTVDAAKNVAYGMDDLNGRQAVYSVALDGTGKKSLLFSRPDVDVDGLITIGRKDRVIGASYAIDRRHVEIFDPEMKQLREKLAKALPSTPIINIIDATEDEKQLLVLALSDVNPGTYYLLDRGTHKMAEVLPVRAALSGMPLAQQKAISFPAADGTMSPAYLTLPPGSSGKNIAAVVMPHGGPSARDEWGFDWLSQFFAMRGYAVLQPNFRGSAGYGEQWFMDNGFRSWRTAVGDVNDAGRWLQREGIAAPGKLAIVGWSYGGYAALQSAVLDPGLFKAIVAIAPVTDLDLLRNQYLNFTSYRLVDAEIGRGPHVAEGSPARNAGKIQAPVLLFHGDKDENVRVEESRLMKNRLSEAGKQVEYVEFPGLDHQLADATARTRLLSTSDAFLRKQLDIP
jgi:dipeptidyl aminopeptidase/acylaminoacyl peptidase